MVTAIAPAPPRRSAVSARTADRLWGSRQSGKDRSSTVGSHCPTSPMRAAFRLAPPTSQPRIGPVIFYSGVPPPVLLRGGPSPRSADYSGVPPPVWLRGDHQ